MEKIELLDCSPVRQFEKVAAPLNDGEIGLITAKKGLGKTSILVQFGLDSLLQDKSLVHVSFDQKSSNVISWYSSILSEIIKKKNISNLQDLESEIVKQRTILNFNQETFTLPKVVNTIKALNDGGLNIKTIVVDGLDLSKTDKTDLSAFAKFISDEKMTAWFSFTSEETTLKATLDKDKLSLFTTVGHLASTGKELALTILKNGEGTVKIDTKSSLFTK